MHLLFCLQLSVLCLLCIVDSSSLDIYTAHKYVYNFPDFSVVREVYDTLFYFSSPFVVDKKDVVMIPLPSMFLRVMFTNDMSCRVVNGHQRLTQVSASKRQVGQYQAVCRVTYYSASQKAQVLTGIYYRALDGVEFPTNVYTIHPNQFDISDQVITTPDFGPLQVGAHATVQFNVRSVDAITVDDLYLYFRYPIQIYSSSDHEPSPQGYLLPKAPLGACQMEVRNDQGLLIFQTPQEVRVKQGSLTVVRLRGSLPKLVTMHIKCQGVQLYTDKSTYKVGQLYVPDVVFSITSISEMNVPKELYNAMVVRPQPAVRVHNSTILAHSMLGEWVLELELQWRPYLLVTNLTVAMVLPGVTIDTCTTSHPDYTITNITNVSEQNKHMFIQVTTVTPAASTQPSSFPSFTRAGVYNYLPLQCIFQVPQGPYLESNLLYPLSLQVKGLARNNSIVDVTMYTSLLATYTPTVTLPMHMYKITIRQQQVPLNDALSEQYRAYRLQMLHERTPRMIQALIMMKQLTKVVLYSITRISNTTVSTNDLVFEYMLPILTKIPSSTEIDSAKQKLASDALIPPRFQSIDAQLRKYSKFNMSFATEFDSSLLLQQITPIRVCVEGCPSDNICIDSVCVPMIMK